MLNHSCCGLNCKELSDCLITEASRQIACRSVFVWIVGKFVVQTKHCAKPRADRTMKFTFRLVLKLNFTGAFMHAGLQSQRCCVQSWTLVNSGLFTNLLRNISSKCTVFWRKVMANNNFLWQWISLLHSLPTNTSKLKPTLQFHWTYFRLLILKWGQLAHLRSWL